MLEMTSTDYTIQFILIYHCERLTVIPYSHGGMEFILIGISIVQSYIYTYSMVYFNKD